MPFTDLLIDTIVVTNPTVPDPTNVDRYGNPVETTSTVSTVGRVDPAGGDEKIEDRDTRVTKFRVFMPAGVAVTAKSTLTWDGRTLRVSAEPETFQDAAGDHHIELDAEEVKG